MSQLDFIFGRTDEHGYRLIFLSQEAYGFFAFAFAFCTVIELLFVAESCLNEVCGSGQDD